MGNLVSDGEEFGCPFCTGKIKLAVSSSPMTGDGKKIANTSNYSLSAPGAQCIVIPNSPTPCQPSVQNVAPGQSPLKVDGSAALGAGCMFMCAKGGLLTVSSSAQAAAKHDGAAAAADPTAAAGDEVVPSHLWEAREEEKKSKDENKEDQKNQEQKSENKSTTEKKDKTSAKERNKESKKRDGAPKNNQAQNKQFKGAVKEIEKKINKKLTNDDLEVLHDEITGKNLSYHDIVEVGVELFE